MDVIDPRTLFVSDDKLTASLKLLNDYKNNKLTVSSRVTEEDLWQAKKIKDAIIHPDTGDKIFALTRMSAFVPVNIPIVVGMINSHSPLTNIFWQWINQSYNVSVNYANRNASSKMTTSQIGSSYAAAVVTSCSLAVGFDHLLKKSTSFNPSVRIFMSTFVPFIAVASAGAINVVLMRKNEMKDGIQVLDENGEVVGVSRIAGKKALYQVTASRVFLPFPVLVIPPLVMKALDRLTFFKKHKRTRTFTEIAVVTASLWGALPVAIGLFPQISAVSPKELESHFHNLKYKNGSPINKLYFNKGL